MEAKEQGLGNGQGSGEGGTGGGGSSSSLAAWVGWVRENRSRAALLAAVLGVSLAAAVLYLRRRQATYQGTKEEQEEESDDNTLRLDFAEVLPEELSLNIFYRCRAEDFVRAAQVSKEWNRLCDDDTIWREIYQRKWHKVASTLSLKTQTRQRSSWKTLYIERDRIEKAYFTSEHCPPELLTNESKQAEFLFKTAKDIYYSVNESPPEEQLGKISYAIAILAIAGEKFEGLYTQNPSDDHVLWSWGSTLSTQATWTSELLSAIRPDDSDRQGVAWDHTNWLFRLACEKYEHALNLAPPSPDGLYKHMVFADYCSELGNKRSGAEGHEYLAKARAYYQRVVTRAQAVQHKRHIKTSDGNVTTEIDTFQDMSAMARAHRGIGTSCLYGAEKLYESINSARSARAKDAAAKAEKDANGNVDIVEHEDGQEVRDAEEQERQEREDLENLLDILREGREHLIACVKLEPDQLEHLITLGDLLTMLGEMHEDPEESEAYFNEGVTNFERALTIEEGDGDALNEFGILLTKRAQRILKLLKLEGLDKLSSDMEVTNTDAAANTADAGQDPQTQEDDASQVSSSDTQAAPDELEKAARSVDPETAKKLARRAELLAQANRYYDQARAKFMELEQNSVWFGAINLACLAALRGQEEETKHWLYTCRDRSDLAPDHLEDRDFDVYREREWFKELGEELRRQREQRQRELEEAREREAEERRRMQQEAGLSTED